LGSTGDASRDRASTASSYGRHRGIAAALLRHTFLALRERGCRMAELHVDSENTTGALELYRSVGMRPVWHQWDLERRAILQ
jgi:ribosomal protein S18 acetylase RimI-like enzyme